MRMRIFFFLSASNASTVISFFRHSANTISPNRMASAINNRSTPRLFFFGAAGVEGVVDGVIRGGVRYCAAGDDEGFAIGDGGGGDLESITEILN